MSGRGDSYAAGRGPTASHNSPQLPKTPHNFPQLPTAAHDPYIPAHELRPTIRRRATLGIESGGVHAL